MIRSQTTSTPSLRGSESKIFAYSLLFGQNIRADDIGHAGIAISPFGYWLCDRLDPERILTVGQDCELLHITLCEKVQCDVMRTHCLHLAPQFSSAFVEARKKYGVIKSQLVTPDPSSERMGAEGQFDLIFLFSAASLDAESLEEWRSGLTPQGLLVFCGQLDNDFSVSEDWWELRAGHQKLSVLPPRGGGDSGIISTELEELKAEMYESANLSSALATCVVDLVLREKALVIQSHEKDCELMRQQHASDLITLTEKLAKLDQENIQLRAELRAKSHQLQQLQAQSTLR